MKELNKTEPIPPMTYLKRADHHWLEKIDYDGSPCGLIVLQWNPIARRWSHSDHVGTGLYVNTVGWKYIAHCPLPE